MAEDCCSMQLIDRDGVLNTEGLDKFVKTTTLSRCGLSYVVVAIVGPQISGKSTLMNHLFYTNFKEMNAFRERCQTTKGIWIAKCVGIEPFTIAMDLEGTASKKSGQDDTTFEKQSSLFALAVADVVLINTWCHDIGREKAAIKPLLKTVFQVKMRLFCPRKTTLLFVIRDKTKTPFEYLESKVKQNIREIWDAVTKPQEHKDSSFNEYFNVEVTALPSYEFREEQFKEQVAQMRQRFFHSIAPGGLAGDRRGVIPASGFSFSAQQIWKTIKENKDLDLPAHSVLVSTVLCEEIANEKLNRLASDEDWVSLKEAVHAGLVVGFGEKLSSILERYFSEYDKEAIYFDEEVKNAKRKQLESRALDLVYPAYVTISWHLYSKAFGDFKNMLEVSFNEGRGFSASVHKSSQNCMLEFEEGCADAAARQAHWDVSELREKLKCDIETYASSLRAEKLSKLVGKYEKKINETLSAPIDSVFEACEEDTWPSIRKLLMRDIKEFSTSVASFDLDRDSIENIVQNLRKHARNLVEKKAREQVGKVLLRMKDRFSKSFNCDDEGRPRVWTYNENIERIAENARSVSLKLLSIMAALRLDEKPDNIESVLSSSFKDGNADFSSPRLASNTWEEVSPEDILITPVQCKFLWKQFLEETEYLVDQAKAQAHRMRPPSPPPPPPPPPQIHIHMPPPPPPPPPRSSSSFCKIM